MKFTQPFLLFLLAFPSLILASTSVDDPVCSGEVVQKHSSIHALTFKGVGLSFPSILRSSTEVDVTVGNCLERSGIGSFESTNPLSPWFTATEGNGTFSIENNDTYAGDKALKVELASDSPWQVRMFSRPECYFDLVAGETYWVEVYLKGSIGSTVTATLMNDLANEASADIVLTNTDWALYAIPLTIINSTAQGRLKFNFKTAGTYLVDNIVLRRETVNWHVSPGGTNSLNNDNGKTPATPLQTLQYAVNNAWEPGDSILVMNGTYQNANYGTGNLNNNPVLNLSATTGEATGWLIIKNYPGHSPKIQFDGAGGIIGNGQTYLEISGLEIEGPNQNIGFNEAMANRLIQDKHFSGRGIAIWSGHHIYIHDNLIHDCPNSAIRTNNGDYCTVDNNVVYNNTWWSSNAESAIVFATAMDIDTFSIIKMQMTNNLVYDNYNNIPYYNPTYTGETSDYGTVAQDYIIDGSGVYTTRNKDTYFYGWHYFANNICYGNGINGLVVHKTDRAIVSNNTCYNNGAVPLSSGRQASSGITVHSSDYVRLYNNISWPRFDTDFGYKIYFPADSEFLLASNNILAKGLSDLDLGTQYTFADPLFLDTLGRDFRLEATSPAVDAGLVHTDLPLLDFSGNTRDASPDLGALEYIAPAPLLRAKVFLGGCYHTDGLMQDNLGSNNLIPNNEPYQFLPAYSYPIADLKGQLVSDDAVFTTIGPAAVVDWVFVEIRAAVDADLLLASRAALLTRAGDIVEVDGVSPLSLPLEVGEYHVLIRHRNHIPVMTEAPVLLDENGSLLDFTANNASGQHNVSGAFALFPGDSNGDLSVDAADRSATWNGRNGTGYLPGDVNMDGAVDAGDRSLCWNFRNVGF